MKDFLSKFMKANRDPSKKTIRDFENLFKKTCSSVVSRLGDKPFHILAGLNSAVFDCVMVSFSNNLDRIPQNIKQRYDNLAKDFNFLKYVRSSTTDEEIVKSRFELGCLKMPFRGYF